MKNRLKLAVVAESTGLTLRQAIAKASEWGCQGIQFDAYGDLAPDKLSETGRREFRNLLRSYNLELSALHVPLRRGLDVRDDLQPRLDYIRKVMGLSFDLQSKIVVLPCPALPAKPEAVDDTADAGNRRESEEELRGNTLRESLDLLSQHGDRIGCTVSLEAGIDSGSALKTYLAGFDRGTLMVCYDPANFMLNGYDPLTNLAALSGLVNVTHARDARKNRVSGGGEELPVGAGEIEWMALIATLESIGFSGYLTVQRTGGLTRMQDVANGVQFLRRFVGPTENP
ncbi:MAG: sugar phosphate isomerase/epimerase family protein [Gemmataceae bacterium]